MDSKLKDNYQYWSLTGRKEKQMMMKGMVVCTDDQSMSNLTSSAASLGEASTVSTSSNTAATNNKEALPLPSAHPLAGNSISGLYSSSQVHHELHQPPLTQPPAFGTSDQDVGAQQPPPKKKRSLPGNPDPDAEVIALSPTTLMATNRFVCEVCNKGFQRDQNLQLHRRGHNLPWKLKQRSKLEPIRKKVYVCPEPSCVHHEPSRALGDLTGIKKHFCRKHGEKKWKCEKCSKRYAVRSDWKAHSKICGTREYRCDCGTLFSRRDSFITHRAFCDALADESTRSTTTLPSAAAAAIINPLHQVQSAAAAGIGAGPSSAPLRPSGSASAIQPLNLSHFMNHQLSTLKTETDYHSHAHQHYQQNFSTLTRPNYSNTNLPPWLSCPMPPHGPAASSSLDHDDQANAGPPPQQMGFGSHLQGQHHSSSQLFPANSSSSLMIHHHQNPSNQRPSPSHRSSSSLPSSAHGTPTSPHMSATALLQKAAQMGVKMSSNNNNNNENAAASANHVITHQSHDHYGRPQGVFIKPNHDHHQLSMSTGRGLMNMSSSFYDQDIRNSTSGTGGPFMTSASYLQGESAGGGEHSSVFHEVTNSFSPSPASETFDGSSFEDTFGGMVNSTNNPTTTSQNTSGIKTSGSENTGGRNADRDGMTRDFLGLRSFSHKDLFNMAALDHRMSGSSYQQQQQHQQQQHEQQQQQQHHHQ